MKQPTIILLPKILCASLIIAMTAYFASPVTAQERDSQLDNGDLRTNPNQTQTNSSGGEEEDFINVENNEPTLQPDLQIRNGEIDTDDVEGSYNPNINVGGENGINANPNVGLRNGRLTIDPEFDYKNAIEYGKQKAIDYVEGFVLNQLGIENYLTQLQQDFQAITGDITTFLGFHGKEPEKGQLGIPNIQEARLTFVTDTDLAPFYDAFGSRTGSTFGNSEKLMQKYLTDVSTEYSENSALSNRGQSIIQGTMDTANSISQASTQFAEDSNGQDVTQNIMRNLSAQLALDGQLRTMEFTADQEKKVSEALKMQISTQQMSEASKANNLRLRSEQSAIRAGMDAAGIIYIPNPKVGSEAE